MRSVLVALIAIHGVIHLVGVTRRAPPVRFAVRTMWLAAALGLLASAALLAVSSSWWWVAAAPALVVSQFLVEGDWKEAKSGTIANLIVGLPVLVAIFDLRPSSLGNVYRHEVERERTTIGAVAVITENDLAPLPEPVKRYLRRAHVVGRPHVHDFRARWHGEMRRSPNADWMKVVVEQHDFLDRRSRLFLMDASLHGVPFQAFHRYGGGEATMQVRLASLFPIVDASGPEMNQSETVTLLDDICLFAPGYLVDVGIAWLPIDPNHVGATFENRGNVVRAELAFDDAGDLVDFTSGDRYLSADGKSFERALWSTPADSPRELDGARIASRGEAVWRMKDGDFVYLRLELDELRYNVGGSRAP